MRGFAHNISQKFMMDRANATADIQQCSILQTQRAYSFQDQPRLICRAAFAVVFCVCPGFLFAKRTVGYLTAIAWHFILPFI